MIMTNRAQRTLLESWETAIFKTGANFDSTIKSFQVTHDFLAKTGPRIHAHIL